MADSITTQADVIANVVIPDNELFPLTTERMKADNWATMHKHAWTLVKSYLLARHPPVEEDDLDDVTELAPATCYAVIYLAYDAVEIAGDDGRKRRAYWFRKLRKALAQADITVDGVPLSRESYGSRRALRG